MQLLGQLNLQAEAAPHMSQQGTVSQPKPHQQSGSLQRPEQEGRNQLGQQSGQHVQEDRAHSKPSWSQQQQQQHQSGQQALEESAHSKPSWSQQQQQQDQLGQQVQGERAHSTTSWSQKQQPQRQSGQQVQGERAHSTTSWPASLAAERMVESVGSRLSHSAQIMNNSPHLQPDYEGLGAGSMMRPAPGGLGAGSPIRPPSDGLGAGSQTLPSPGQGGSAPVSGICSEPGCQEMAEAYAGLAKLLEVKDQMIWHLLKERNELLERLASGSSDDTTRFYEAVE